MEGSVYYVDFKITLGLSLLPLLDIWPGSPSSIVVVPQSPRN